VEKNLSKGNSGSSYLFATRTEIGTKFVDLPVAFDVHSSKKALKTERNLSWRMTETD
jgi:hypothetical protein